MTVICLYYNFYTNSESWLGFGTEEKGLRKNHGLRQSAYFVKVSLSSWLNLQQLG